MGTDSALVVPRLLAPDTGLGADSAVVSRTAGQILADTGLGADAGLITPLLLTADQGAGADSARVGVYGSDQGVGTDSGLVVPRFAAVDAAVGADMLTLLPRMGVADQGAGADSATAVFSPRAAVVASWAAAGTYTFTIPVWCRYIDIVLLGAGGGGASPGTFYTLKGHPGEAGTWVTVTLERGVHIPWTAITITITVGTGGARGSGVSVTGVAGQAGTATTVAVTGWSGASAAGGAGGGTSLTGTTDNVGRSPGNIVYNDLPYSGGAAQSSNGGAGNAPGGGGAGGGPFGGAGGVGAPGGAWLRAYQ
ncbi:hypothetical protein H8Z57_29505 [Mycolicibacterium fortuitum]|nr:hypothetical protein H8Z57_29505 [Mycolicibacterium fortuitum]